MKIETILTSDHGFSVVKWSAEGEHIQDLFNGMKKAMDTFLKAELQQLAEERREKYKKS